MRSIYFFFAAVLFLAVFSSKADAQVASTVYRSGLNEVRVTFTDDLQAITLTNTLLFFEDDTGRIVQVICDTSKVSDPNIKNAVTLRGFRDVAGVSVNLAGGGGGVTEVPAGRTRTYNIVLKGVRLTREPRARPIQTSVDVDSVTNKLPDLIVAPISNVGGIPFDRRIIDIHPEGIAASVLRDKFQGDPGKVRILYKFSKDDPSPDVQTSAASIKLDDEHQNPADLLIEPREKLPLRAKKYTVQVVFPADQLQGTEKPGFFIPADAQSLTATAVAELAPSGQTDRAKTEFFVETTFTSTVNAKNHARANVGIFGVHWKPTLPLLTYNVFGEEGAKPVWMAFRPLFEADVDTQSPKVSKSPNRVQFGMDYELGRDAGLRNRAFIQQHVWINGVRYDSDRDFKLQTIYWHTEYVPRFLDFEQTTEGRQFAFDIDPKNLQSGRKGPFVSSYRIKPSIGYELGGLVRRDTRATNTPTETINRPFVGLDLSLELRRIVKFGVTSTYYYLANADRRRNRAYTESRFELNTGYLFNRNFNGLQNAILFKFQRGEQPPTFGPVNALSVGFKIFR
jgi:hypothetical protein